MAEENDLKRRLEIFRSLREKMNHRWKITKAQVEATGTIGQWVADNVPTWLLPSYWIPWVEAVNEKEELFERLTAVVDWLNQLDTYVERGVAEFRPSETKPGDIDVLLDLSVVPEPPESVLTGRLGLVITGSVIAVVGIVAFVTTVLAAENAFDIYYDSMQEKLGSDYEQRVLAMVESGKITPAEAERLFELKRLIKKEKAKIEKAEGTWTLDVETGLEGPLKWAAILTAVGGGVYLIKRWHDKRKQ